MRQDLVLYRYSRGLFWGGIVVGILLFGPAVVIIGGLITSYGHPSRETVDAVGNANQLAHQGASNLAAIGTLVALLFGATAGSIDRQTGVLRDLVLAGRSRTMIVMRRLLAAFVWVFAATLVALGLIALFAVLFAPVNGHLRTGDFAQEALSLAPGFALALVLGAGFAMLIGSRGPAVGAFFLINLIIDNLLLAIPKVGDAWEHVSLSKAIGDVSTAIMPGQQGHPVDSMMVSVIVVVAWALVVLVAGLVRLRRRDL
ncbi:MAG: family transporter protein [Thermoleophilia bacterium]|nr:family transporter protein [Thermoleophilia bacterium]